MFEFLITVLFIWLAVKVIGLMLKITWGAAKLVAGVLLGLAFPALILCLVFAGGFLLLIPLVIIAIAAGILKLFFK
jgi:hypothetical protein